ncbi:MAG TPA: 2-oxoacid:ferredoxin oxidoreductase subunit beta, partial [Acidimicrobiales bacterium]|nr:2-oxoacid:ferredoxin oxidoreductase subunit beta [Acidimicrobiales bacterium]
YQNCNVFNDGAFEAITGKEVRPDMLIPLVHGQPIRFGADNSRGVMMQPDGRLRICDVNEVGEQALLVHDERREPPGLAFQLSHLSSGPHEPTPIGVFRAVERPTYETLMQDQLIAAQEKQGPGDLARLLASGGTWEV